MEMGLNLLSGKWRLKILWQISQGPVRFNALRRHLGTITTKILTQELRELEVQGIVSRTVYPETPPKVEYALTELGTTLQPILHDLCAWGLRYQDAADRKETTRPAWK